MNPCNLKRPFSTYAAADADDKTATKKVKTEEISGILKVKKEERSVSIESEAHTPRTKQSYVKPEPENASLPQAMRHEGSLKGDDTTLDSSSSSNTQDTHLSMSATHWEEDFRMLAEIRLITATLENERKQSMQELLAYKREMQDLLWEERNRVTEAQLENLELRRQLFEAEVKIREVSKKIRDVVAALETS